MKTPLRYQASEFDCGPTAVLNAVSYLYMTEEIPPEFVKAVYMYTMDEYDCRQHAGRRGTSPQAMRFLTGWFERYAKTTGFPMHCEFYQGDEVHLHEGSPILRCLADGGAVVSMCLLECEHFVTLTGMDEEYIHVFDPYYWDMDFDREGIIKVYDRPREMNRRISRSIMDCQDTAGSYSFCSRDRRIAMLFYKTGDGPHFDPQVTTVCADRYICNPD